MATSLDTLVGFANLLGQVRGKSQTTTQSGGTTTQTQQTQLDQTAIDRMIQQMLSGQGGQAAISGAARGSGLYDSTTERQQLNDLNARVAGEVAQRSAPTVTTTEREPITSVTETPGTGLSSILAPMAVAAVGRPIIERLAGIGGSTGAASSLGGGASTGIDLGNITAGPNLGTSLGTSLGGGLAAGLGNLVSGGAAETAGGLLSGSLGSLDDFASTTFSAALPDMGGTALSSVLSGVPLGPMLNLFSNPDAMNLGSFGTAALTPLVASLGPVGAAIAPIMPLVGSLLGGISVVCTALEKKGLLNKAQYQAGYKYIGKLHFRTINGYYLWGVPLAKQIDKGNKIAITLSLPFARQRTALLAGAPWYRNPLGLVTKYIGEPTCYALGYIQEKVNGFGYSN